MMGDEEFRTLYDAYVNDVFRFARSLCGSVQDAEEVVQNTFLKLAIRYDTVRHPSQIKAWLLTVCRNEVISLWRHKKRRENIETYEARLDVIYYGDSDPAKVVVGREQGLFIRRAIDSLPPKTRMVILCRLYIGLNATETASTLGWSAVYVRVVYSRGLKKLRDRLRTEVFAPWETDAVPIISRD